ncbi:MAG: heme ABC exporter ATP-binding protein CcmA [Rhizobacter sp.]|nr:heme ABC exporter ATP-binding protein CcmA [Burkholderiales bacterium]
MRLVVEKLAAERGGRAVFADLSFVVEAGTLLRVSGANGAGKTTLLRILAGLAAAADGNAAWHANDDLVRPAEAACFVGHANAFNDALSVKENLAYAAALSGHNASSQNISLILDAFGMKAMINRSFGTLSQGQRKRCSLARLLLLDSDSASNSNGRGGRAWLLDEPFVALDVDTQAQLATVISAKLVAGGLVIYTSHQAVDIHAANTQEILL